MLTFDWTGWSETEIEELLVDRCSAFGQVTVATVLPPEDHRDIGSAIIRMSSIDEADALAHYLGDSRRGSEVTVRLVQHAVAKSSTSERNYFVGLLAQSGRLDIQL